MNKKYLTLATSIALLSGVASANTAVDSEAEQLDIIKPGIEINFDKIDFIDLDSENMLLAQNNNNNNHNHNHNHNHNNNSGELDPVVRIAKVMDNGGFKV